MTVGVDDTYDSYDSKIQGVLEKEASIHGDILQDDFIDSYRNMTIKTIMAFRWFHQYCAGAQFVMKADDDVFINTPALLSIIELLNDELQKTMFGRCYDRGVRVYRNKMHKWFVTRTQYNGSHFMPYCVGIGYIMGSVLANKVASDMPNIPIFPIEDAYVGTYIKKFNGSIENIPGFGIRFNQLLEYTTLRKVFSLIKLGNVLLIHKAPDDFLNIFWKLASVFSVHS